MTVMAARGTNRLMGDRGGVRARSGDRGGVGAIASYRR